MGHQRFVTAAVAGITALLTSGGLLVTTAPAAQAGQAAATARALPASSVTLPGVVSQSAADWTPNVFAGSPACNPQWFGTGGKCTDSTVWSQAVVNGEVVVAGAFTQACQPGPGPTHCKSGTLVTRDDIFAYQAGTGIIDPNFKPLLDQGPVYSVVPGPGGTVYAAGQFTTVNGVTEKGIVQLSVAPGMPSDGQVVTAFKAKTSGTVNTLALNGGALYAGGSFNATLPGGSKEHGLARLNATTGAADPAFKFTIAGAINGAVLVQRMAVTTDGSMLAIAGQFLTVDGQSIPRLALIHTGGGFGVTATLDTWSAPVFSDPCSHQHNWVRGLDFSPDGSYFVIADTGYKPGTSGVLSICDAVARFETGATGTSVQPTWVNYAGGDSMYSAAVTGSAVYIGGHNRWINNECGNNHVCEANSVLVNGLAALDPNTGLALPWWHPQTLRGNGVVSLVAFPAGSYAGSNGGLLVGTNVNSIGGAYHSENALFPLTSTASSAPGGPIRSGMFSQGRLGGEDETTSGTAAMCVDDNGNSSVSGAAVQLRTCANDAEQNWTIESDGTIQINGLCLDTSGGTASGTPVVVNTCNSSSTTQVWKPGANGSLANNAAPGMCLNDPSGSTMNGVPLVIAACNGSTAQSWPLPSAQAPPPPPPTGSVYLGVNQQSTQVPCLDNASGNGTVGANVQLATCDGSPPQQWTWTMASNGSGTFQNFGLCMDTANGATTAGTLVVLNTCSNSSTTQVWTPGANGSLVNQGAPTMCLDDPGSNTANGVQLQINPCNGQPSQHWWLPEV